MQSSTQSSSVLPADRGYVLSGPPVRGGSVKALYPLASRPAGDGAGDRESEKDKAIEVGSEVGPTSAFNTIIIAVFPQECMGKLHACFGPI
jgi:hypothetical protein